MIDIFLENALIFSLSASDVKVSLIKSQCCKLMNVNENEIYLLFHGKLANNKSIINNGVVHAVLRNVGGKGGFGSMLRAIGAQIEKTTNREACRDLSGRRLRDINEEKRLKTWIAQQVDREKEAADNKQKKLQKLCEPPKHEFKDEMYDNERSVLPEKIEDSVLQGLKVADKLTKRKLETSTSVKKKKPKLWLDDEDEIDLTSDDSEIEDPNINNTKCNSSNNIQISSQ